MTTIGDAELAVPTRRSRRRAWRLLFGHIRPHVGTLIAGGLLGLLGGVAALAEPMVTKQVIDSLGQRQSLLGPVLLLTALMIGGALLTAASTYLLGRMAESVVLTARERLVSRLLRLRVGALDRLKPGDLLSRVTSDTTLLRSVSGHGLTRLVNGVLLLGASLVLMATLDATLLGLTLAVLALNALALFLVVPRIRRAAAASQAAVGGMGSVLERALSAFPTVKASGAEHREIAAVDDAARAAWRRGAAMAGWTAVMEVSAGLTVQLSFLVVLGVGGLRVASGTLPISSLIAFLLYLFLLTEPVNAIVSGVTQLQAGLAAVRRMREIEDLPVDPHAAGALPPPDVPAVLIGPASVEFRGVWFRYRYSDEPSWVHRDLSFEVPAGGTTAIVGPSGTGKTTIFALLERFYEPAFGSILVGGRDIREWQLSHLRAAIGYVEQEAPVLDGTLRDNLLLAAPDASEEQMRAALALTQLDDLLGQLDRGLDTPLGHHGVTLSGGQRQRVALARALLRRPRVLLLDEASAQLDAVNEMAVRDVIADVARTTTVLVSAHRLSTVTSADRILVVDEGRLRAAGTHRELVESDEMYHRLAATQWISS
ncbi:MAG TPA: ABC transporter ATP-binding protein [Euzebyales bacterium]|nr:ABC transporter ATP-binding protein [Euzebyales bacterium]